MLKKMLLIKTGRSETFCEKSSGRICSFGDVLRTSFILHFFKSYSISWATDEKAIELLKPVLPIESIINFDSLTLDDFSKFDLIINLEKDDFSLSINHREQFGFVIVDKELYFKTYPNENLLKFEEINKALEFTNEDSFQMKLCKVLGFKWEQNDFNFSFKSESKNSNDIGLNWKVGPKWPKKEINKTFWEVLDKDLSREYKVSWQEGFANIKEYINWIDSCKTIITLDSLGLHLAIALRKNIIAVFGPTNSNEVEIYDRGVKINYDTKDNFNTLINIIKGKLA